MDITTQVPDALGRELQRVHDHLPAVLERGLREVLSESDGDADHLRPRAAVRGHNA